MQELMAETQGGFVIDFAGAFVVGQVDLARARAGLAVRLQDRETVAVVLADVTPVDMGAVPVLEFHELADRHVLTTTRKSCRSSVGLIASAASKGRPAIVKVSVRATTTTLRDGFDAKRPKRRNCRRFPRLVDRDRT